MTAATFGAATRAQPAALRPGPALYHRPRGPAVLAWVLVLALHAAGLLLAWRQPLHLRPPPATPAPQVMTLTLLPPPPPPLPPPPMQAVQPPPPTPVPRQVQPTPQRAPARRMAPSTVPSRSPAPQAEPAAPTANAAPLPMHQRSDSDEWEAPAALDSATAARVGVGRAPSDYADSVKARVVSQVVYPPGAVYPKPKDFKGDPLLLRRQCTIPYELVIDRQGAIVSYEIEGCDDVLLDAAAEAAILKAQPFPKPPPGAERYRVFGTVNFLRPRSSATQP